MSFALTELISFFTSDSKSSNNGNGVLVISAFSFSAGGTGAGGVKLNTNSSPFIVSVVVSNREEVLISISISFLLRLLGLINSDTSVYTLLVPVKFIVADTLVSSLYTKLKLVINP